MKNLATEDKLNHKYQQLYESLSKSFENLVNENNALKARNATLEAQRKQWEVQKTQQEMIIQQALGTSNSNSNRYLEENNKLREEIKKLKI